MNGKQPMVSTLLAITLGLAAAVSAQEKNTQQAAKSEKIMSAPSKAGACKPDNPARSKVSHQTGTELCA